MYILKFNAPEYTKTEGIVVTKGTNRTVRNKHCTWPTLLYREYSVYTHWLNDGSLPCEEADTEQFRVVLTPGKTGNGLCLTKQLWQWEESFFFFSGVSLQKITLSKQVLHDTSNWIFKNYTNW